MAQNVVGARELKTRLGTYLRRVRAGLTLVITDRGEPVAELRPLSVDGSLPPAIGRLAARGAATLPTADKLTAFRAVRNRGASVVEAIRQDRADAF
jgi:prevent-host-death family protein